MVALAFLFLMIVLALIVFGVVPYFSVERRDERAAKRLDRKSSATKTRQLHVARTALTKIAAADSGNPSLDANIALEDIAALELKELESND